MIKTVGKTWIQDKKKYDKNNRKDLNQDKWVRKNLTTTQNQCIICDCISKLKIYDIKFGLKKENWTELVWQ